MFKKILYWTLILPASFLIMLPLEIARYLFSVMGGELEILGHRFEHWCYEYNEPSSLELSIKSIRSDY